MKFQVGLGLVVIMSIIGGILFLVLDDKYFCLKNQRAELADVSLHDSNNSIVGNSRLPPITSFKNVEDTKVNWTEEEELLNKKKVQYTEKDDNRDLLMRMAAMQPGSIFAQRLTN